jgi:hypothetical protein
MQWSLFGIIGMRYDIAIIIRTMYFIIYLELHLWLHLFAELIDLSPLHMEV